MVLPGTPAVLLLWRHRRYYRCGAVLPLVAPQRYYGWVVRYYHWDPDKDKEKWRDLYNGMEKLGG